jgi:hypothetical protein
VTGAERKDERLTTVPRRVELFAARDADTDVVHDGLATSGCLFTRAHDDVLDEEVIRRGAEVRIDKWFLRHAERL